MSIKTKSIKTLKVRVRDKHSAILNQWAFEVNQIWNNANAITAEYGYIPVPGVGWFSSRISAFDLAKEQAKTAKSRGFDLHSQTIQETTEHHAKARKQFKKNKLRWRCSSGSNRALGWVPFKAGNVKWKNGTAYFNGHYFKVWDSYGLSNYTFKSGSFSEDSRGRWYLNIVVEVDAIEPTTTTEIGIDLGLKDYATCSDGIKLTANKFYRGLEEKLGKAQRAKKKKLVKSIHAKIKNRRKDSIHKFTTDITKRHALIVVGDVDSSKLAKTKMAKSVYDAGWYMLKTQLKYKAMAQSAVFLEVSERYTTQICSCCGCISDNSPKGMNGLGIREWICSECGAMHDRDVNAAKNILRMGHHTLAVGIPFL
jgi:IS605 OrfB family transposase